jgi:hypothetical protein
MAEQLIQNNFARVNPNKAEGRDKLRSLKKILCLFALNAFDHGGLVAVPGSSRAKSKRPRSVQHKKTTAPEERLPGPPWEASQRGVPNLGM